MKRITIPARSNETDKQIDKKLKDRFAILKIMTEAAISGDIKSLIISGPAGLGKSFTVEEAIEEWDPTEKNPSSFMPPFGKHGVITKEEIEKIIDYLYTL